MDSGNEDYGIFLKSRVLSDHVRQLETVEFRHANVHQNYGDFIFQQLIQSFSTGMRFEQIFVQFLEDYFVAEQLGRLIIYHEYVNFLLIVHLPLPPRRSANYPANMIDQQPFESSDETTSEAPTVAAQYSPALPNTPMLRLPYTFRDLLSWLWLLTRRLVIDGTTDFAGLPAWFRIHPFPAS